LKWLKEFEKILNKNLRETFMKLKKKR